VGGQRPAQASLPRERDAVRIVQEAGCASEPVWMGPENLAPTGVQTPGRPTCTESLYRLRYPDPSRQIYPRQNKDHQVPGGL
jgi:hypothetical protein